MASRVCFAEAEGIAMTISETGRLSAASRASNLRRIRAGSKHRNTVKDVPWFGLIVIQESNTRVASLALDRISFTSISPASPAP